MDAWQFVYVCESILIVSAANVYIRVHIDGWMATYLRVCEYVYTYIHTYIQINVCIRKHVHIYINLYSYCVNTYSHM